MGRRPLCVALVTVIMLILLCYHRISGDSECIYKGEAKTLICQVEGISGQGESQSLTVCDVMENGTSFCSRIRVYQKKDADLFSDLQIGNIIIITGEIYSFSEPGNPGQFDERRYYREMGIDYKFFVQSLTIEEASCRKLEQWLHERRIDFYQVLMACLPEEEAGIVAAMVLGEKCALTEVVKELYQENGIAHILAISGLHISMIGAGLFFFLRRFIMPMKPAALMTGILLLLYGELTGFPVATKRAVIMMLCVLAARFLGRRYDLLSALALSALIQLSIQPVLLFQSGFLLSYGTVLGIAVFVGVFTEEGPKKYRLWQLAAGSLGVSFVTLPILLYFYYEMNPYSVLVNAVILPFVSMLLAMSLAGGCAAAVNLVLGRFLFGVVHMILRYYQLVCTIVLELPFAQLVMGPPELWQIVIYYVILFIWSFFSERRSDRMWGKRHAWMLAAAVVLLYYRVPDSAGLHITNLDVGQGDCTCICIEGTTILVDGGSSDVDKVGKYRISKYLKYKGIQKIDYIFLSHSDSDHINGILEILEDSGFMGFRIGTIVLPDIGKQSENYRKMENICRKSGVTVQKMSKSDQIQIGSLFVRCLHPEQGDEWKSENDYSLVLSLSYGQFHGLLTGDLEQTGEEGILNDIRDVDYLKVGHHGSKGSCSEAFLERLKPEISVISAGENNRYGHPSEETLKRLKAVNSEVFCTSLTGAVTLHTDGNKTTVQTYK